MVEKQDALTEIELELLQQSRLLEVFSQLETYDARQSIIMLCEKLIRGQEKG